MNERAHDFEVRDGIGSGPRWVIRAPAARTPDGGATTRRRRVGAAGLGPGAAPGRQGDGRGSAPGGRVAGGGSAPGHLGAVPGTAPGRRSADPPVPPKDCAPGALLRTDGSRSETAARGPRGQRVVIIRALSPSGRHTLAHEADLLELLERDGASAFPRILWRDEDCVVREDAAAAVSRAGRRRAEVGSPRTTERLAQLAAREGLETSLEALHRHGWVLGAQDADGLGIRDDGTVLICDLTGLRIDDHLRQRLADRRWVDAALGDAGRTLRRPADAGDAGTAMPCAGGAAAPAPADAAAPMASARDGEGTLTSEGGVAEVSASSRDRDVTAFLRGTGPDAARVRAVGGGSVSGPPGGGGERPGRGHRGQRRRPVRSPAARRGYAVVVALVFLGTVGAVVVAGGRGSGRTAAEAGTTAAPSTSATSTGPQASDPGPRIASGAPAASATRPDAPATLVGELAARRQARLVSGQADTATLPGSPARDQDDALTRAYAGLQVHGWRTEVHRAEVTAFDAAAGSATVRATITESERTIVHGDGTSETVAASPAHTVELDLRWSEGGWLVERTRAV